MKGKMKKFLACIFIVLLLCASNTSIFAANTTTTGTGTVNGEVTINGTITPLTISVTHPLTVSYAFDPNNGENGTFTAPDIAVTNNTKVPVNVSVGSLKASQGGTLQFTDVLPSDKVWSKLNLEDSKKYLALGILIKNPTGWNAGYNTTTKYAANEGATLFGTLPSAATGTFTLSASFGMAFDSVYTASHSLVFMFNLN